MKVFFADVVLPLALPKTFTYRIPQNMVGFVEEGIRVVVPFGKRKLYTGIIVRIHEKAPQGYTAKYIDDILDENATVNEKQLKLWDWISSYYLCTKGEVMLAAMPSAMRLGSESKFIPNPAFDGEITSLSDREQLLLQVLTDREVMSAAEVSEFLEIKSIQPTMKKLLDASAILVMEDLKAGFKPKIEKFVRLTEECRDEDGLEAAFRAIQRAPKQEELLMAFIQLSNRYGADDKEVQKTVLQKRANANSAQVMALAKKGIFDIYEKEVGRLVYGKGGGASPIELSDIQQKALDEIQKSFEQKQVALLHGVTSSGKTEIYISLIKEQLEKGKQVLYMLPEIALTTQMINRLKAHFGDQVAVYHSKFSQNERVELWQTIGDKHGKKARVVLGARSSIFLPFSDLGLVIVDEEHESSFKQFDPAPRYNGRDAAIVLAGIHGAKTLLGSATPSFESYYNAKSGKYGYVELTERFGGVELPEIQTVSLSAKDGNTGFLTKELIEGIKTALDQNEQVILFQNRRGYAPILLCNTCGWSPECTRCDVSLTYHKSQDRFVCHYCGSRYSAPPNCAACGSHSLRLAGVGTERIEEELPIYFPEAQVERLDLDSTRSKHAYSRILGDFQNGSIDILIGTQMVTKGLDFDRVSLVGILNADLLLKFPDFRARERAYQLMTQVAGRAGRKQKRGKVIIQSQDPNQWLIQQVKAGNYEGVLNQEIKERREFSYPPFTRLIRLTVQHKEMEMVDFCASELKKEMLSIVPEKSILGPEYPMVARVKNRYNKNLLLKINRNQNLAEFKTKMNQIILPFFARKEFKSVRLIINVDPY
ncbi:MAG: primosomal protein N' [Bacteroidota bacterium]